MKLSTILKARRALKSAAPLPADCGELCGARCCRGDDGDGVLLLPGEEKLLFLSPGLKKGRSDNGRLYVSCPGKCVRAFRPFLCRIYPLGILWERETIRVVADPRAKIVCPLLQVPEYIAPSFVAAVRRAGKILARDPEGRAFLRDFTRELREYHKFIG